MSPTVTLVGLVFCLILAVGGFFVFSQEPDPVQIPGAPEDLIKRIDALEQKVGQLERKIEKLESFHKGDSYSVPTGPRD